MHRLIVTVGDLPAVVGRPAGPGDARPAQPAAGPAEPPAAGGGGRARRGPGGQRPADADGRRAERLPAAARRASTLHAGAARTGRPSDGPDRYRRGLYTFFWRSAPHPGLTVFDAPDATAACTRRNRSNTPLQALTLLNDQAFFEVRPRPGRPRPARGRARRRGRLRLRLPPVPGAAAVAARGASPRPLLRPRSVAGRERPAPCRTSGRAGRLGAAGPGAAQPRRVHHPGVSRPEADHADDRSCETTRRHFFRDCGLGLGAMALASPVGRRAQAAAARRPARWRRAGRTSPPGRRASSSCSWPAGRASWSCSTTSRS